MGLGGKRIARGLEATLRTELSETLSTSLANYLMTIEHDIPIPPQPRGRPITAAGKEIRSMRPGDSKFFTDSKAMKTAVATIYQAGGKPVVRQAMNDGAVGWRVWRKT